MKCETKTTEKLTRNYSCNEKIKNDGTYRNAKTSKVFGKLFPRADSDKISILTPFKDYQILLQHSLQLRRFTQKIHNRKEIFGCLIL